MEDDDARDSSRRCGDQPPGGSRCRPERSRLHGDGNLGRAVSVREGRQQHGGATLGAGVRGPGGRRFGLVLVVMGGAHRAHPRACRRRRPGRPCACRRSGGGAGVASGPQGEGEDGNDRPAPAAAASTWAILAAAAAGSWMGAMRSAHDHQNQTEPSAARAAYTCSESCAAVLLTTLTNGYRPSEVTVAVKPRPFRSAARSSRWLITSSAATVSGIVVLHRSSPWGMIAVEPVRTRPQLMSLAEPAGLLYPREGRLGTSFASVAVPHGIWRCRA